MSAFVRSLVNDEEAYQQRQSMMVRSRQTPGGYPKSAVAHTADRKSRYSSPACPPPYSQSQYFRRRSDCHQQCRNDPCTTTFPSYPPSISTPIPPQRCNVSSGIPPGESSSHNLSPHNRIYPKETPWLTPHKRVNGDTTPWVIERSDPGPSFSVNSFPSVNVPLLQTCTLRTLQFGDPVTGIPPLQASSSAVSFSRRTIGGSGAADPFRLLSDYRTSTVRPSRLLHHRNAGGPPVSSIGPPSLFSPSFDSGEERSMLRVRDSVSMTSSHSTLWGGDISMDGSSHRHEDSIPWVLRSKQTNGVSTSPDLMTHWWSSKEQNGEKSFAMWCSDIRKQNDRDSYEAMINERMTKIELLQEESILIDRKRQEDQQKRILKRQEIRFARLPKKPHMQGLTLEERQRALELLSSYDQCDPKEIVANKFNIDVSREAIQCLQPGEWLNDDVLNYYFSLLQERNDRMRRKDNSVPKCYFWSTFFYTKMSGEDSQGNTNYSYENVRRWTKRKKIDLFAFDQVYVPVHVTKMHWTLGVVDIRNKLFRFFDSLNGLYGDKFVMFMMRYLQNEYEDKKGQPLPNPEAWQFQSCDEDAFEVVPLQANGYDCGVFVCQFAEALSDGRYFDFSQDDINDRRLKMVCQIMDGHVD